MKGVLRTGYINLGVSVVGLAVAVPTGNVTAIALLGLCVAASVGLIRIGRARP